MAIISDLQGEVLVKVENRTADTARAQTWLKDALIELASDQDFRNEFSELEVTGPTFNLTATIQEYEEVNFISGNALNAGTLTMFIWTDFPTNSRRQGLRYTSYAEADKYNVNPGLPIKFYRYGSKLGFFPVPDKNYQTQARCLRYHPINAVLGDTTILLPQDWNEVLTWAAAMRGFMELEQYEKAGAIRGLLYGDPKHPDRPGLIASLKKKREKESFRQEVPLRPRVRRLCAR